MTYQSLWNIPKMNGEGLSITGNIQTIMTQQCEYLEAETNGKIKGIFGRINSTWVAIDNASENKYHEEFIDPQISQLTDANELYEQGNSSRYGFEVFTEKYKFRVFELKLSSVYPIYAEIDEDIRCDEKDRLDKKFHRVFYDAPGSGIEINSEKDFLELLSIVFSSRKMQYLLWKLQQN